MSSQPVTIASVADLLQCPSCTGLLAVGDADLVCVECRRTVPVTGRTVAFEPPRVDIIPSKLKPRGPEYGTAWRRANWAFYDRAGKGTRPDDVVIDVGAGRADLKPLFAHSRYHAVDVYDYPEVDIVGDASRQRFLRTAAADAIVLSNVLEHLSYPREMLIDLSRVLKPGGRLYMAVPFLIKLHQIPVDCGRYTHFVPGEFFAGAGLDVVRAEAVYTPFTMARSHIENALFWPGESSSFSRIVGRAMALQLRVAQRLARVRDPIVHAVDRIADLPATGPHAFPAGYHFVLRRQD